MKNLVIALAVVFTGTISNATSLHPDTYAQLAELTNLHLNQDVFVSEVESAKVKLNAVTKQIQLTVHYKEICPKPVDGGFSCMAVTPEDYIVNLPIVSVNEGVCGATVYTAQRDQRMVDGNLEVIKLTDFRSIKCKTFAPILYPTIVSHKIVTSGRGGVHAYKSNLAGVALHSPFVASEL
jgi:hypothetical protein